VQYTPLPPPPSSPPRHKSIGNKYLFLVLVVGSNLVNIQFLTKIVSPANPKQTRIEIQTKKYFTNLGILEQITPVKIVRIQAITISNLL